jgi:hypothetical protein
LLLAAGLVVTTRKRPKSAMKNEDLFPQAYALVWLVFITQNLIAQLVTGPYSVWNEMAFKIYYILLMAISAVILYHFHQVKKPTGGVDRLVLGTS